MAPGIDIYTKNKIINETIKRGYKAGRNIDIKFTKTSGAKKRNEKLVTVTSIFGNLFYNSIVRNKKIEKDLSLDKMVNFSKKIS
jgi:hypothetical protein